MLVDCMRISLQKHLSIYSVNSLVAVLTTLDPRGGSAWRILIRGETDWDARSLLLEGS